MSADPHQKTPSYPEYDPSHNGKNNNVQPSIIDLDASTVQAASKLTFKMPKREVRTKLFNMDMGLRVSTVGAPEDLNPKTLLKSVATEGVEIKSRQKMVTKHIFCIGLALLWYLVLLLALTNRQLLSSFFF
jgi:hypothetical protein